MALVVSVVPASIPDFREEVLKLSTDITDADAYEYPIHGRPAPKDAGLPERVTAAMDILKAVVSKDRYTLIAMLNRFDMGKVIEDRHRYGPPRPQRVPFEPSWHADMDVDELTAFANDLALDVLTGEKAPAGPSDAELNTVLDDILRQVVCNCGNYRHHGVSWMPEGSGEGLTQARAILRRLMEGRR